MINTDLQIDNLQIFILISDTSSHFKKKILTVTFYLLFLWNSSMIKKRFHVLGFYWLKRWTSIWSLLMCCIIWIISGVCIFMFMLHSKSIIFLWLKNIMQVYVERIKLTAAVGSSLSRAVKLLQPVCYSRVLFAEFLLALNSSAEHDPTDTSELVPKSIHALLVAYESY